MLNRRRKSGGAAGLVFLLSSVGIIAMLCCLDAVLASGSPRESFAMGGARRGRAGRVGGQPTGGGGRGGGGGGGIGKKLSAADPFGVVKRFVGSGKRAASGGGTGDEQARKRPMMFPRRKNKKGHSSFEEEEEEGDGFWGDLLAPRWPSWRGTLERAAAVGAVLLNPFGLLTISVGLRRLLLELAQEARMSAEPLLLKAQAAASAVPFLPGLSCYAEMGLAWLMSLRESAPGQDVFSCLLLAFLCAALYGLVAATHPQVKVHFDRGQGDGVDEGRVGSGGSKVVGGMGRSIMGGCLSLMHGFRPTPLLLSGHLQTGAVLARKGPTIIYDREMLQTGDGGFISLDWLTRSSDASNPNLPGTRREAQTILLVLHGLTGGSQESYVRSLVAAGAERGMRVVVMNNRGCAGSSLATPQAYSAAWTADVRVAVRHLRSQHAGAPLLACGFSLGANILAKYVGEEGERCPLVAAAVVSNPYDLLGSNEMMHRGLGPIYDRVLCQGLVRTFAQHKDMFARNKELPGWDRMSGSETVLEFDDRHTRRVYGYDSAEHYYDDASSSRHIPAARIPLLSLVAKDDFLIAECQAQYPPKGKWCTTAVTNRGGHVAWYQTPDAVCEQWADTVVLEFLVSALDGSRGMPN